MRLNQKTRFFVTAAVLAAISAALMFLEFPLPLLPPFLKLDLSGVPVLIGAFVLGPLPAVAIALVKDLIHLFGSSSAGVGELADFIATGSLGFGAGLLYRYGKSLKSALLGCAAGIALMTVAAAFANFYLILPFYAQLMPIDAILALCAKANPVIRDVCSYILFGVVPFNLIKGLVVCAVTIPVFRRLGRAVSGE